MRAIVCRVGRPPTVETLAPGLASMQAVVGGWLECVALSGSPFEHGIDLWCNEEGLLLGLPFNRLVSGRLPIAGDLFIAAHDAEGETIGLTDEEIAALLPVVESWPVCVADSAADARRART